MHGLPRPPEPVTYRAVIRDRTSDGHLLGPPNTRHRNTSACQSILGQARLGWPSRGGVRRRRWSWRSWTN